MELVQGAELNVTMRLGTASITGTVEDDEKPTANAFVLLLPIRKSQAVCRAVSDQKGRFEVTGIAPGEYTLFAFESLEEGEWQETDFIAPHERHGERIKLEEKARESRPLTVIR